MTPGTYLRKRRQAAGLSVQNVAQRLASLPTAHGLTFNARIELLNRALLRIEANVDFLTPEYANLVRTAFPFDAQVYARLAAGTLPVPRICKSCACTHSDPCGDGEHTCSWSQGIPDLCTTCEAVIAVLTPGFIPLNPDAIFAKEAGL